MKSFLCERSKSEYLAKTSWQTFFMVISSRLAPCRRSLMKVTSSSSCKDHISVQVVLVKVLWFAFKDSTCSSNELTDYPPCIARTTTHNYSTAPIIRTSKIRTFKNLNQVKQKKYAQQEEISSTRLSLTAFFSAFRFFATDR